MRKLGHCIGHCCHTLWLMISATLLAVAFPAAMAGETMDSLYALYLKSPSQEKLMTANKIFLELKQCESMDTLLHYDHQTNNSVVETQAHYRMAEYYFYQGQFEDAVQACLRARNLIDKKTTAHMKSDIMGLLANIYFRLGQYDKSLESLLVAYHIDKQLDDKELISSDLNTFASIYIAVKQPQPGIDYIEKAIAIERKLNDDNRLAIRLGIASELYLMNGEIDKAMTAIKEAYEIDYRNGRDEKIGIRLSQMGEILESQSKHTEAQSTLQRALSILEKSKNSYSTAVCHNQLGRLALKLGDREASIMHHKKALAQSIQCGAPHVERDAERGLWEAMRETNPAVAMIHLERYTALSDSLQNHIAAIQMNVMNTTAQVMEQAELNKGAHRNRWLLTVAGIILSLIILSTVIILLNTWRRNKRVMQLQQQTLSLRSHFIDNITHKLHTPLTVIMNAGNQLRECPKMSNDELHHMGDLIHHHGNSMLALVNQLLDIENTRQTADADEQYMRSGDIAMFVRWLTENYSQKAHDRQISVEFICPTPTLHAKFVPEYIRKIIHTLIENAFKFTQANGTITVMLEAPDKSHLMLKVSDTGKGIPVEELNGVFEPFYQSAYNNHEGVDTVIDLTLVKQLVEQMKGTITVESQSGKGTTFTMVIPFIAPTGPISNATDLTREYAEMRLKQETPTGNKPLVFIVENNDDVAFFVGSYLRESYDLRFASDGQEALLNARDLVPDLIITNMTLPVIDGKELTRRLRSDNALCHIPIIALTATNGEQERISCLKAGVDAVLVKPFNSMELILLAQHLTGQRAILADRLTKLNSDAPAPSMSKEDQDFINRLVSIIHAQMARGDIDMDRISAAMSLSRKMLRQRVMSITGQTPVTFALQVRLKRACRLLVHHPEMPLSLIATKCGFQTPSHFSKSFKQQYGTNPLQYRKQHGSPNVIDYK